MMKDLQTFIFKKNGLFVFFLLFIVCSGNIFMFYSHLNNMGITPAFDAPSKVCFYPHAQASRVM